MDSTLIRLPLVRVSYDMSEDGLSKKGGLNVTFKKADEKGLDSYTLTYKAISPILLLQQSQS
jgi:hypothetical protein